MEPACFHGRASVSRGCPRRLACPSLPRRTTDVKWSLSPCRTCVALPDRFVPRRIARATVYESRVTSVQSTSGREVTPRMHRSDDTEARREARRCFGRSDRSAQGDRPTLRSIRPCRFPARQAQRKLHARTATAATAIIHGRVVIRGSRTGRFSTMDWEAWLLDHR
jgi:hypothetical protein